MGSGGRGGGGGATQWEGGRGKWSLNAMHYVKWGGSFSHAESGEHKMFRCSYTEPGPGRRVVVVGGGGAGAQKDQFNLKGGTKRFTLSGGGVHTVSLSDPQPSHFAAPSP